MSAREERLAENEAFFRKLNEHIQTVTREPPGYREFVCECGDTKCTTRLALTESEYESVRGEPTTFLVVPTHVAPDIEVVVLENERFAIVRKRGEAAEVAIEEDPRS